MLNLNVVDVRALALVVTERLAALIVGGRPETGYASWVEIAALKGVGPVTLGKLQAAFGLEPVSRGAGEAPTTAPIGAQEEPMGTAHFGQEIEIAPVKSPEVIEAIARLRLACRPVKGLLEQLEARRTRRTAKAEAERNLRRHRSGTPGKGKSHPVPEEWLGQPRFVKSEVVFCTTNEVERNFGVRFPQQDMEAEIQFGQCLEVTQQESKTAQADMAAWDWSLYGGTLRKEVDSIEVEHRAMDQAYKAWRSARTDWWANSLGGDDTTVERISAWCRYARHRDPEAVEVLKVVKARALGLWELIHDLSDMGTEDPTIEAQESNSDPMEDEEVQPDLDLDNPEVTDEDILDDDYSWEGQETDLAEDGKGFSGGSGQRDIVLAPWEQKRMLDEQAPLMNPTLTEAKAAGLEWYIDRDGQLIVKGDARMHLLVRQADEEVLATEKTLFLLDRGGCFEGVRFYKKARYMVRLNKIAAQWIIKGRSERRYAKTARAMAERLVEAEIQSRQARLALEKKLVELRNRDAKFWQTYHQLKAANEATLKAVQDVDRDAKGWRKKIEALLMDVKRPWQEAVKACGQGPVLGAGMWHEVFESPMPWIEMLNVERKAAKERQQRIDQALDLAWRKIIRMDRKTVMERLAVFARHLPEADKAKCRQAYAFLKEGLIWKAKEVLEQI